MRNREVFRWNFFARIQFVLFYQYDTVTMHVHDAYSTIGPSETLKARIRITRHKTLMNVVSSQKGSHNMNMIERQTWGKSQQPRQDLLLHLRHVERRHLKLSQTYMGCYQCTLSCISYKIYAVATVVTNRKWHLVCPAKLRSLYVGM